MLWSTSDYIVYNRYTQIVSVANKVWHEHRIVVGIEIHSCKEYVNIVSTLSCSICLCVCAKVI